MQTVKISQNRTVSPNRIIVGNKYENEVETIKFQPPAYDGNRYLIINKYTESYAVPLPEDIFYVDSLITWTSGFYNCNYVITSQDLSSGERLDGTKFTFVSDTFTLGIKDNFINAEQLSKQPMPINLQIVYDDLLSLYDQVKSDYDSGKFDGADGKSAYEIAVENGFKGSEEEWLESLRYDHSDEFEQLATQVKQDADRASNAMTSATEIAQENIEAIQSATEQAQNDIVQVKTQALNDIASSKSESLEAIETAKDEAIEEIENTGVPLEDIEKLAIKETAQGNPTIISDSADWKLKKLEIYGQSEQDSTTGAQLLDASKIQTKTLSGATITNNGDGSFTISGSGNVTGFFQTNKIEIKPIKKGKIYLKSDVYIVPYPYIEIYWGSEWKRAVANDSSNRLFVSLEITQEDIDNNAVVRFSFTAYEGISIKSGTTKVMVYQDGTGEFEPYTGGKPSPSPDYPQEIISKEVSEIKIYGTNLFDLEKEKLTPNTNWNEERQCFYPKGVACYIGMVINEIWDIAHESGNLLTVSFDIKADKNGKVQVYSLGNREIRLVSGTAYAYINATQEYVRHYVRFSTLDRRGRPNASGQGDNCALSFYGVVNGESIIPEVKNICISITENTDYIPFESQTITLSEPIILRGIPVSSGGNVTIDGQQYVSDVIAEKDRVIGVERNINEILVSSIPTNNLNYGTHTNGQPYLSCVVNNSKYQTIPMSDRYIGNEWTNQNGFVYIPNSYSFLITDNRFSDEETAISIITEEQTKVVYVMNEPTFEPLPEEIQAQYKELKSYYPTTVIDTGCWNEVEYIADTKTYIDNKLAGVTELALGGK